MADQRDRPSTSLEVLVERVDRVEKAIATAYAELQHRLDELNHSHRDAKAKEVFFLPREVHDQFFNEYRQTLDRLNAAIDKCVQGERFEQFFRDFGHWRDEVNSKLAQQAGATQNTRLWMAVITLVLLAFSVAARWFVK
jgi:exonuclease VII large subunit